MNNTWKGQAQKTAVRIKREECQGAYRDRLRVGTGGKCWVEGVIESQGRQWIVLVE